MAKHSSVVYRASIVHRTAANPGEPSQTWAKISLLRYDLVGDPPP
jgi:hypothetical protein